MSLLDGMPRSASARAVDEVAALYVSKERFTTWVKEHPAAAYAMLQMLARRVREATDQVAGIALLSVEARVARQLWQQFAQVSGDGAPQRGASLRINQTELARAIGVTRESVNKHLARMRQSGVIETSSGRVTIVDPEALRTRCETI
jgi:CRP-like cAMP-binding protein